MVIRGERERGDMGDDNAELIYTYLDVHDLCETGKAIQQMIAGKQAIISDTRMMALASAYHKYISCQTHSNFHGKFYRTFFFLPPCSLTAFWVY